MAWKPLKVQLTGVCPLITHNAQLSNPRSPIVRQIKAITSKKTGKTEADLERLSDLELLGGLYVNESGEAVIPGVLVESMLVEAAKATRKGKEAKCGLYCDETAVLEHDGPRTAEELKNSERNRLVCSVRVKTDRVIRTRPIFHNWKFTTTVHFEDAVVSESSVLDWLKTGGLRCGIGTWRPRYGRFTVSVLS